MICNNCKSEIMDNSQICVFCGFQVKPQFSQPQFSQPGAQQPQFNQQAQPQFNQQAQPQFNQAQFGQQRFAQPGAQQPQFNQAQQPQFNQQYNQQQFNPQFNSPFNQQRNQQFVQQQYNPQFTPQYAPPRQNGVSNISLMYRMNIFAVVAAALMILCIFLPYASVLGVSTSLIKGGDGWIFLGLALVTMGLAITNLNLGVIITGVIGVGLSIFEIVNFNDLKDKYEYNYTYFKVQKEFGYYLMTISSALILVAGIVMFIVKAARKNKGK